MKISMKSYEEIVESLGGTFEFVDPKYAWRAYKGGEYLVFSDKPSALGYSRLVEKFIVNQEEYDLNMSSHMAFEDKVKDLWENELWHTTSGVPYSVFKLSLIKACDEYNINYSEQGREIILELFYINIDFAKKILNSVN